MPKFIAVTIGDIKGIGIKILFDSWKRKKITNFILFTDINVINKYLKINQVKYLNIINKSKNNLKFDKKKINIFSYKSRSLEDNTYKSLKFSYDYCKKNICMGVITLPLRKDLIKKKINKNFIGHTEYFQTRNKKNYSNMILYHQKIIISPLTTHIEIRKLPNKIINKKYIHNQILNLINTLKIDFNLKKPKILVSGFNPHAGENGEIGKEEILSIFPVIKKLQKKGFLIDGPLSADSILIQKNLKKYDCFVFMYHDQALIPFKYISKFTGVNYTGNLDIIRTSPDHGTAYDLVKTKKYSINSFINCYKLIKQIYKNRIING